MFTSYAGIWTNHDIYQCLCRVFVSFLGLDWPIDRSSDGETTVRVGGRAICSREDRKRDLWGRCHSHFVVARKLVYLSCRREI
jgi:hypothetical protein